MKSNRWEVAQGASNLGEDDLRVAVLKVDSEGSDNGIIKIAYCAYSGLKIIEITGVSEVMLDESGTLDFSESFASHIKGIDWEVGLLAKLEGHDETVIVTVDDCECVELLSLSSDLSYGTPSSVEVLSSEEYMVDDYDVLDIELLKIFSYI